MALSKIQTSEMLDAPNLGRRNLVINGAMQVAQRGISDPNNTAGGYKSVDRFRSEFTTLGTWTVSQSTDAPAGFANSLDHTCTTGKASPASQDTFRLSYRFEGQDLQHLQKGTSSAKSCTISFWIKSNKTGTGQINIRDIDNNRGINKTYTIDAANTWEYKTILIEGDTTGTISNDNGSSFWLMWAFYSGTDNNSGTFNDAWGTWSWTAVNASGTLDIGASASDYVKITGVQLEVGDTATDFEHRSYGEELSLCQRYFESQHYPANDQVCVSNKWSGYAYMGHITCMEVKRTEPTVSSTGVVKHMGQASFSGNITPAWQYQTPQGVGIYSTATSGPTGDALLVLSEGFTVNIDAEL